MKKNLLAIGLSLALTSCSNFTPILARNDGQASESGSRLVVESLSKDGASYTVQMMRQRLANIHGSVNLDKCYKTHIRLSEESGNLAYAADATATRSMMRLNAQIIISCDGQTVYETKVSNVTSYSQNANDEFANQSASTGAIERLIEALSIDISRELQKFAKSLRKI